MVLTVDEKRYGRLLAKALPAVIRNGEENERTLSLIESMMDKGDNRTPEEDRLLKLLARLAADFEAENYDFGESKPNEVMAFLLESRGMRQVDLLPVLGCSNGALSDMITVFFRLPADLFI